VREGGSDLGCGEVVVRLWWGCGWVVVVEVIGGAEIAVLYHTQLIPAS
jgi:hypothetical protein